MIVLPGICFIINGHLWTKSQHADGDDKDYEDEVSDHGNDL